jgi:signal transduction histidine kinase/DNA-binding response OmpR family regulator
MPHEQQAGTKATILVVDDNHEHLRVLRDILKNEGYEVRIAPDGPMGLISARTSPPDVLLLDVSMPTMDGYEVCRQLKSAPETCAVPIIFISAMDATSDKIHAFAAGGVDYITKPFQADEVLARLNTHLALRQTQQQLQQQNTLLQQEIAERYKAENALRRTERALRALSQCNESMLRANNEHELLQAICQNIVEHGGYRMAWVGYKQHDEARHVHPVAQAGDENGYIQTLDIRWDESERGRGPTGTAIRTGTPCMVTDMMGNSAFAPWRTEARKRGYASSIALPLVCDETVLGALNVYSTEPDSFDGEEVHLLTQLADNLAYGIGALRSRTAREQAEITLREQHERLQMLSRRLVEVQEQERRAIARELHDEVGQILTGLNLSLEMLTRAPPDKQAHRIEQAQVMLNDLMVYVREMSMQLRPPMLDDLGLLPTLLWHIERYTAQTSVHVIFKHTDIDRRFAPALETTSYRIIQEALTNIARHAQVSEAMVQVWALENRLGLQVADQGCGFDPAVALAQPASSGLAGIQERVRLLGGKLQLDAAPGEGSCLTVEFSLV